MDVKTYCDNVGIELTGWKAKLYDVIRKANKLPQADKEKVEPMVVELNAIVDDLGERLEFLLRECPTDWNEHKTEIEGSISRLNQKWKTVWGVMGDHEYGIGGA